MLAVLIGGSAVDQRRAALASDLAIVSSIARELCRVGDSRGRICEAIAELTAADCVLLAESGEAAHRTITASAGLDLDSTGASHRAAGAVVGEMCGAGEVTGGLHHLTDGTAVLYEPLVLDGRPVGILAAGWRDGARRLPDRTITLVSMVAAEAAVAIDRESLLTKLEYLARRDELTGLLNRRVLGEELDLELAAAHRHDRPLSVVMLDLDHFKSYNDTCGHQAGDRLLKGAAAAWVTQLRNTDLIARYGGEEFIVILPGCGIGEAILTAGRLRQAVPDGATCSAGVAALEGMESAAQLIGRADLALYHAKASGRDCTAAAHLSGAVEVVGPDSPLASRRGVQPAS
jgi:diguanylate cyclase (GGDEF)-like protein